MLRAAALLAALAATVAVVAIVAVALITSGGNDERAANPAGAGAWAAVISTTTPWACPTATPSPTGGSGVMPFGFAGSIPLASPTPSAEEALLRNASLRPEDLPDGFSFQYEEFTTNQRLIAIIGQLPNETRVPGVTQEELDCWGRALGHSARYMKFEGLFWARATADLLVTADLFRDSGGAGQYFAWLSRDLSDPPNSVTWTNAQLRAGNSEWGDSRGSPISFSPVGDERIAGEMTAAVHYSDPDLDYEYAAKTVVFRSGRVVGTITVSARNSVPPHEGVGTPRPQARPADEGSASIGLQYARRRWLG